MLRLTRITSSIPSSHHALPSSLPISTLIPSSLPCLCTSTSTSTSPSPSSSTSFRTFATRVMPPKVAARPTLAQKFAKASGIPRPDALGRPTPEPSILPPIRYDHPYTNPRVSSTEFPITDGDVSKYLEQQKSIVKEATIKTRDREIEKIDDPTPIVPLSFAIIDINNHQHKITAGDLLMIDRIDVPVGVSIVLHKVMLVGTQTYTIVGRPTIPGAEVHGTIEEHTFLSKTLVFHRKRRKNHRKWKGHRDRVTMLRIDSVVIPEVAPTATLPAPSLALPLQSPTMVHVRTKPIISPVTEETQEQTA